MRTKINIVSWAVFLTLVSHMTTEKKFETGYQKLKKETFIAKKFVRKKGHG